ncbi:hypothetical protein FRC04_003364 [Tulasnella sp. 424]|nr:hypothetical protein FRC04_003364 [Tulasnella sp. 424]KAG8977179.1 hypothetical protein FRC05_002178 [Tulasnella sp. 425]
MQDFDISVERCAGDIVESFTKLNGPGTGTEKTFGETLATLDKFADFQAAIAKSVRTKTFAWLRHRNSLTLVYKLPIELLQSIFHLILFASNGQRRRNFVARLHALRSVSWMWRDLIDWTPSLWTQLSSDDHIEFVSQALQKSQKQNLRLKYDGKLGNGESSPFLEQALVHLDRWEYVVIQEPHGLLVEKYFSSPAPRLKRMVLSTKFGYLRFGPGPPSLLFRGELADLEEFRAVRWRDTDWIGVSCHRLTVLEIEDCFMLDMETLFGIIAENPNLRILRIHFITFRPYTHPPKDYEPIVLSRLTDFTFTNIAEIQFERQVQDIPVMRMLRRLRFPACVSFAIEIGIYGDSDVTPEDFLHLIPRPIEIFTRGGDRLSRPKPPTARVEFWDREFECHTLGSPKSNPKYSMVLRGVERNVGVEWTRRELVEAWTEAKPNLQLQYWVDNNRCKLEHVFYFQDLESVVGLEVMGSSNVERPVGSGLARRLEIPVVSASGSTIGPFLHLQTLRFSYCSVDGKQLLRVVKERFFCITNPSSKGEGEAREANAATGRGLSIIWGEGMKKLPRKITRDILAVPGVKDIKTLKDTHSGPADDHDGSSSISSEESDWYPHYPDSDEGEVEDEHGDDSSEAEIVETDVTP